MESKKIYFEKGYQDIQTKEIQIEIKSDYRGKEITAIIYRNELTASKMHELRKIGFPFFTAEESGEIVGDFADNEGNIPIELTYKTVGFHEIDGKTYFLHRKALENGNVLPICYNGDIDLGKKGSLENNVKFFNHIIAKHIGLQTICAVALSSAVVGMLLDKDLKFIFHIEGTSTSGKTTSLMLAGSMWGNPKISVNGVVKNWNTTDNKLIQSAGGNKGIMIGLDELSMSKADNTLLTYLLTSGADKRRMTNIEGADSEFRTIFMSTGEIQFKSSNFGGIGVRLFEVKNYNFTQDKETADIITKEIHKNYGYIGFGFAKALTAYSVNDIQDKLESITEKVIKRISYHCEKEGGKFSPLFSRIAEKIAAVVIAAKLSKKKLGLNFDINGIVDFLICNTTVLDIGQEQSVDAMEKFLEEYTKNRVKFPKSNESMEVNIWGKSIFADGELSEIVVMYNQFVKMMNKIGYPDTNSLIKALKEKGFIKCEDGKNYTRRKIGDNKRAKAIVIDVFAVKRGDDDEI